MTNPIPERKPIRRGRLILGIGAGLVLALAVGLAANSRRIRVWYHTRQMNSGWKETFSQPGETTGDLVGYSLGEPWTRYEAARDALVDLGEYRRAEYQFRFLKQGSPDGRHFFGRLMSQDPGSRETPPAPDWILSDSPNHLGTMTIWGPSDKVDSFVADLNTHDVADYTDRFRRPAVLARSRDYIEQWPTLGMWLPDHQEVRFFRNNYDLTREILRTAIHSADDKIRRNALYVVGQLEGTARDLGPDLVQMLALDPLEQPNTSVIRTLTAIRYRSPECQRELSRYWDAGASNPKTALTIAVAQYVISASEEERQRAVALILKRLEPVPEGLGEAEREAYLDAQLDAIITINGVRGLKEAEAPLERLLKDSAALWTWTQIPYALKQIRRPVEDSP